MMWAVRCLLLSLCAVLSSAPGRSVAPMQTGGTKSPARLARWTSAALAGLKKSSCKLVQAVCQLPTSADSCCVERSLHDACSTQPCCVLGRPPLLRAWYSQHIYEFLPGCCANGSLISLSVKCIRDACTCSHSCLPLDLQELC
jgi:hypothetical protein